MSKISKKKKKQEDATYGDYNRIYTSGNMWEFIWICAQYVKRVPKILWNELLNYNDVSFWQLFDKIVRNWLSREKIRQKRGGLPRNVIQCTPAKKRCGEKNVWDAVKGGGIVLMGRVAKWG